MKRAICLVNMLCIIIILSMGLTACGNDPYSGNFSKLATEEELNALLEKVNAENIFSGWTGFSLKETSSTKITYYESVTTEKTDVTAKFLFDENTLINFHDIFDGDGFLGIKAYLEIHEESRHTVDGKKNFFSKMWADEEYIYVSDNMGKRKEFWENSGAGANINNVAYALSLYADLYSYIERYDISPNFFIDENGDTIKLKMKFTGSGIGWHTDWYVIFLFKNKKLAGIKMCTTAEEGISINGRKTESVSICEKFDGKIDIPNIDDYNENK